MPPDPDIIEDEDYESAEDEDFAPDQAAAAGAASDSGDSASEAEDEEDNGAAATVTKKKAKGGAKKRKRGSLKEAEAEDVGFENSGDEEIVEKGLKKRRRRRRKGEDSDDGGEGGFVRTRRMAALAPEEKKKLVTTETSTIDVDALWASMLAGTTAPAARPADESEPVDAVEVSGDADTSMADAPLADADEDMITIQRTYNFAGQVHTETKVVHRDSAEAKLHLASQPTGATSVAAPSNGRPAFVKRAPKKARRSIFEPVPADGATQPQRTDLFFGANRVQLAAAAAAEKAKKLTTVEKSKMDWAGFVDREGLQDELATAGRAKGAYMGQREFLARVEGKREEEGRRARLKAAG